MEVDREFTRNLPCILPWIIDFQEHMETPVKNFLSRPELVFAESLTDRHLRLPVIQRWPSKMQKPPFLIPDAKALLGIEWRFLQLPSDNYGLLISYSGQMAIAVKLPFPF